jgi:hypothetical protein
MPERKQTRAADDEEDEAAGEAEGGGSTDVLDNAWFVPASRINDYKNTEMDYWCALWFWPIRGSSQLSSREQWWMEIGTILEGNVVDLTPQPQFDFAFVSDPQPELPGLETAT